MAIQSDNFEPLLFLLELRTQCKLVELVSLRLEKSASHWISLSKGDDDGLKAPPIEIVSDCVVCLSALAAISRILCIGERRGKKFTQTANRCEKLMQLLDNPWLEFCSIRVRHDWEHMDERLDELFSNRQKGDPISAIYVAAKPPKENVTTLRRFDPVELTISHCSSSLNLRSLAAESRILNQRIDNAISKLSESRHSIR